MCNQTEPPGMVQLSLFDGRYANVPVKPYKSTIGPLNDGPYLTPQGWQVGQWGMISPGSKTRVPTTSQGDRMSTNNARRETVAKSWTFGTAWREGHRCLIPALAWIEPFWGTGKNIWWSFRRADGDIAALAGLYSEWTDPETGEVVPNYTMLTQNADAHPLLSLMHRPGKEKRAVVVLERGDWDAWLNGSVEQASGLIRLPARGVLLGGAREPAQENALAPEMLNSLKCW